MVWKEVVDKGTPIFDRDISNFVSISRFGELYRFSRDARRKEQVHFQNISWGLDGARPFIEISHSGCKSRVIRVQRGAAKISTPDGYAAGKGSGSRGLYLSSRSGRTRGGRHLSGIGWWGNLVHFRSTWDPHIYS